MMPCYRVKTEANAKNTNNFVLTEHEGNIKEYWGILALGRDNTKLAAFGPYCHDRGPIILSAARAS